MIYYTIHFIINTFQKTYKNRPDFIDNILQIRYNNVNKLHIRGIAFMRFKKLLSVALAVSMLGTSSAMLTANAEETTSYKLGDVNLDGKIDINDLNKLQDYIFGDFKPTADNTAVFARVADINRDGTVDENDVDEFVDSLIYSDNYFGDVDNDWSLSVTDATYIQKYLVGDTEDLSFRQILNGDYNKDNSISVVDATEIQKQLVGLGKSSSFPTAAIKETDAKYRGTYDSTTGTYKGGEYSDAINYIEETTNISFKRLLENDVYIVKTPRDYPTGKGHAVWLRDKNWCYSVIPRSGQIRLWGCYSNDETMIIPISLAGYKVDYVCEFFGERELFPNYPSEKTTIDSIKTLIIPNTDGYMEFSSGCFEGLKGLQNVVFQEGVNDSQFSGNIFKSCKNLKNVIWPDSLEAIPAGFFWNCKSITSIQQLHLPTTVNEVQENVFWGSGLQEITIPEHIRTIKRNAFRYVPARTVTFLYKKMVNYDFEPYIFNMSGTFLGEKYTFYGYKNSSYESIKKDIMNICKPKEGHIPPLFNYLRDEDV